MTLSSHDIKQKQFKRTFRGFDPTEVSTFLVELASAWEETMRRGRELEQKNIELDTQLKDFKSMEKAIEQTFMQAQETSGRSIENSRKEAQLVLREAEVKASQIMDKARNDLIALKEQITILKAKKDSIVSRLKMLLNSELELIKALEVDEELSTNDTQEVQQELSKDKTDIEEIIKSLDR